MMKAKIKFTHVEKKFLNDSMEETQRDHVKFMQANSFIPGIIKLTTQITAINNPNRIKILEILEKSKKPLNILQIKQQMNISYKSVYENVKILSNTGFVKLHKNPLASGQAVTVEFLGIPDELMKCEKA